MQNGTVAAASYAGSTLAYVTPHMAGAIDILVVEQPDGSLKSSPFYGQDFVPCIVKLYEQISFVTSIHLNMTFAVRFGKYTGIRSTDRNVQIIVNGGCLQVPLTVLLQDTATHDATC